MSNMGTYADVLCVMSPIKKFNMEVFEDHFLTALMGMMDPCGNTA